MKLRSFKLRMALLSVLTSGMILAIFASLFMSVIRRVGIERIDRQLQALGDAPARGPKPHEFWAHFDDSLSAIYGAEKQSQFLIKVNDRDHHPVYASPRWPAKIRAADLGISETKGPGKEPEFEPPPFEREPPREWKMPPPPRTRMMAPRCLTLTAAGHAWRFIVMESEDVTLTVGMDLSEFHREIDRFRNTFAVAAPLALLLLAAAGWLLAGQAIRPVKALTRVAAGITAKGLDQRVQTQDADHEFQALIDVINSMLNRLEKSFRQATRFSADAAHELNTPLTILQGQMEQAIQSTSSEADQRLYAGLLEEVQRLKNIVRKLLLLAKADTGQLNLNLERIDLAGEIDTLLHDADVLAPGLKIDCQLSPGIAIMADPDLLRQALQNLLGNAIKYNRPEGLIRMTLCRKDDRALFTIGNTSLPSLTFDEKLLFTRFYRGDSSRSRQIDGVGLGLSLSREIVLAHQGSLVLQESKDGWVSFTMSLPCLANEGHGILPETART